jgi:hypothetical protein
MKNILFILTLLTFLTGCLPEEKYKITEHAVYMTGWSEANGDFKVRLEDADPKTFEIIETDCNSLFGKDKDHVYVDQTMIENADPTTFKYIGNYYFSDSDSVYFFGFFNFINECEVWGVNPTEFRTFETYPWARDNTQIIHGHTVTRVKDIDKFQILGENWGRTTDKVFYKGVELDSVDIATFEVISDDKARDKKYVYLNGDTYIRKYY